MAPRAGVVLTIVTFILILTPLAYAGPPDPTWQVGVFDDGDFDQVVGLITSATGLADVPVPRCPQPVMILLIPRGSPSEGSDLLVLLSVSEPRAPPSD